MKTKQILLAAIMFYGILMVSHAQNRIAAFEMNERLGRGVNMGNCFEAPSETEWGNPWKPEYFRIMAELGFSHVRLPVRWETPDRSMATAPFTINPDFLGRIKQVVDTAINNQLYIIVNMHHHEALFENPDAEKERFLSQWNQIAAYFKDYPDKLLFEVLNEPHGNLTPEKWNVFFTDALSEIRKTNPTRTVIMGVADYGGLGGLSALQLPDDENIIVSPHYYNPFNFTHQGAEWVGPEADNWLGTKWLDTEAERQTVENEFGYAIEFSETNHIPIHVGEFGAYNKADLDSRSRWTTFLARWFEEQKMSWAYWEFSAGFGFYNPETNAFLDPLVDALLINEMPEPVPIISTLIYQSDFSGDADGWILNTQSGASGSLTAAAGKLNISLTNAGTEPWHAQLVKNNISLQQGKMYRVSCRIQSSADRSATSYVGKAIDPWTAYSGYTEVSISETETMFTYTFTMTSPSDPAARLVFDLGQNTEDVIISEVKVEELKSMITGTDDLVYLQKAHIYPNPVVNTLHIKNLDQYEMIELFDINGRSVAEFKPASADSQLDMSGLPRGVYLLKFSGDGPVYSAKIIKE